MLRFALIGAAGYIAPRHMKAIKAVGGDLVAAVDPHDSVGILDRYFPETKFFINIEQFDRHLEKLRREGTGVDYVSICSPNYLHDAHCRLALRLNAHAICEKPLVINPWNLEQLSNLEAEYKKNIYPILQLRYHPDLMEQKKKLNKDYYKVKLTYVTPRGPWYQTSWKGSQSKSGGIITNIGIHLFDLLLWFFGGVIDILDVSGNNESVRGILRLERAEVRWLLSIDNKKSKAPLREMIINNDIIRFDNIFTELHSEVYRNIVNGKGKRIEDIEPATKLVYGLTNKL